jgi:hypothetical protein
MPKARKRRKGSGGKGAPSGVRSRGGQASVATEEQRASAVKNRAFFSPPVRGVQSLIWPLLVAFGCWGLAISFLFFSVDPNHTLFAGMAALLALAWSFSVGARVRKLLQVRART